MINNGRRRRTLDVAASQRYAAMRKEQPMNLIEKALRYIYIYILTSKAGLEYDLQSREVWRGKRGETSRSKFCAQTRLEIFCEILQESGVCEFFEKLHRESGNRSRRRWNDNSFRFQHNGDGTVWRKTYDDSSKSVLLIGGRLTSKEVAA